MRAFLNPVVAIALLILLSLFVLIGTALVGWDHGMLSNMSRAEFARGLITYIFAVTTIGTAVVLVVSVLTSPADEEHERQFQHGKEILSLLLGVFGTIVGFYFGAEVAAKAGPAPATVQVLPLHLSSTSVVAGEKIIATTHVSGGKAPYVYAIRFGEAPVDPKDKVEVSGWISTDLTAPPVKAETEVPIRIGVRDAEGRVVEAGATVLVKPSRANR